MTGRTVGGTRQETRQPRAGTQQTKNIKEPLTHVSSPPPDCPLRFLLLLLFCARSAGRDRRATWGCSPDKFTAVAPGPRTPLQPARRRWPCVCVSASLSSPVCVSSTNSATQWIFHPLDYLLRSAQQIYNRPRCCRHITRNYCAVYHHQRSSNVFFFSRRNKKLLDTIYYKLMWYERV